MNYNDDIKQLEKQLAAKKDEQARKEANCNHDWDDVKYDPEKYRKEIVGDSYTQGSHVYFNSSFVDATRDRWRRTCKNCGRIEYTYEQKPVAYAPDFK